MDCPLRVIESSFYIGCNLNSICTIILYLSSLLNASYVVFINHLCYIICFCYHKASSVVSFSTMYLQCSNDFSMMSFVVLLNHKWCSSAFSKSQIHNWHPKYCSITKFQIKFDSIVIGPSSKGDKIWHKKLEAHKLLGSWAHAPMLTK